MLALLVPGVDMGGGQADAPVTFIPSIGRKSGIERTTGSDMNMPHGGITGILRMVLRFAWT